MPSCTYARVLNLSLVDDGHVLIHCLHSYVGAGLNAAIDLVVYL